jgi:hypothetical protein
MPHRKSSKTTRKVARSTGSGGRSAGRGTASKTGRATTRSVATRESRRPTIPSEPSAPEPPIVARAPDLPPHELYRHEKRRRAGQRSDGPDPLEEARRVFQAMIEAGVGTPRGGRPRKVKPRGEDDLE